MGDPLSVSASVVTVLGLAKSILSYANDVKNASTECRRLILDITYVQGLLNILHETVQDTSVSADWQSTVQALQTQGNPLQVLQSILQNLKTQLEKHNDKRGPQKLLSAVIWPLKKHETEAIIKDIERQKSLLSIALDNDHVQLSIQIKTQVTELGKQLGRIGLDVQSTGTNVEFIQRSFNESRALASLHWLSTLPYQSVLDDVVGQRVAGSLTWILDHPAFKDWVEGQQHVLVGSGIPGAGKTVRAATVTRHLRDRFDHAATNTGVAGIFFSFKSRSTQTPLKMLASIAAQLVAKDDKLKQILDKLNDGVYDSPERYQVDELLTACQTHYSSIYLVIDALDEYSEDSEEWRTFVQELKKSLPNAYIFITTRPHIDVGQEFTNAYEIDIVAHDQDVLTYVRYRLKKSVLQRHLTSDESLRQHIEKKVVEKSQGMFLLPKLHMDALSSKARYNKTALRNAVDQLPLKLDAAYDMTLERIRAQNTDDAQLAIQTMSWIYHAFREMELEEIQQALARQRGDDPYNEESLIDRDLLLSVCAGLITINTKTQRLRFVHPTIAEYFDRFMESISPNGGVLIASICINDLKISGLLRSMWDIGLSYGDSQGWNHELQELRLQRTRDAIKAYVRYHFSAYALKHINLLDHGYTITRNVLDRQSYAYRLVLVACGKTDDPMTDIPLAVFLNHPQRLKRLLHQAVHTSPDAVNSLVLSPLLVYAIITGKDGVARLLVEAGADVTAEHTVVEASIGSTHGDRTMSATSAALLIGNSAILERPI